MPPKPAKPADKGKIAPRPAGSGKAKKKKWSKGKLRDKLNHAVLFDKVTYDKLIKEVPTYKMITPSIVSERLKIRASLARQGIRHLVALKLIKEIVCHHKQQVYARCTIDDDKISSTTSKKEKTQDEQDI